MNPPDMLILAVSHAVALLGGMGIVALFTAQKIRRAQRDTWAEAERLHRARALQDLRDHTSTRSIR